MNKEQEPSNRRMLFFLILFVGWQVVIPALTMGILVWVIR